MFRQCLPGLACAGDVPRGIWVSGPAATTIWAIHTRCPVPSCGEVTRESIPEPDRHVGAQAATLRVFQNDYLPILALLRKSPGHRRSGHRRPRTHASHRSGLRRDRRPHHDHHRRAAAPIDVEQVQTKLRPTAGHRRSRDTEGRQVAILRALAIHPTSVARCRFCGSRRSPQRPRRLRWPHTGRRSRAYERLTGALRVGEDIDDDIALDVWPSGTTGTLKGAMLTPAAPDRPVSATHDRLGGPGTWLLALPTYHIAGMQILVQLTRHRSHGARHLGGSTSPTSRRP